MTENREVYEMFRAQKVPINMKTILRGWMMDSYIPELGLNKHYRGHIIKRSENEC